MLDEREIPDASERSARATAQARRRQEARQVRKERPSDKGAKPGARQSNGDTEFVYVSLGRKGGVRPGDLVGAIANETGLSGREIGPIRITDNYSVVGVPASAVDNVVSAMGNTVMRGKKAKVRRYSDDRKFSK